MDGLVLGLEILLALLLLGLLWVAGVAVRRRWLGRGFGAFDCSLRRRSSSRPGLGWSLGVARYGSDTVDWFRVFGFSPRPSHSLVRRHLTILGRRVPAGHETFAVMTGFVVLVLAHGEEQVELAMSEQAATGFASWVEAGPPGQHVNVA